MKNIKKIIEKEELKNKKNPGKQNKAKRKALNSANRGDPIPLNKVVTPKKQKQQQRQKLKKSLQKELKNIQ